MSCFIITGGAGYIGSHVSKQLLDHGHEVVIIDNLSTGFKHTIQTLSQYAKKRKASVSFYTVDLADTRRVEKIFKKHPCSGLIHFAASVVVPESVENPMKYYVNNTANSAHLIRLAIEYRIPKFIFSSTAAVYGDARAEDVPVIEAGKTIPINPYGWSKLFTEQFIQDAGKAHAEFKYVILRYFNVAGADLDGLLGQSTENATHLVKVAAQAATGKRKSVTVFGRDFDTPDGTGVRDYIHVADLADAHIRALEYLDNYESDIFNCGYGEGYSVDQIISTMKKVSGVDFEVQSGARRPGDSALLISNNTKIKEKMGWRPQYNNIEVICRTAFEWEQKLT